MPAEATPSPWGDDGYTTFENPEVMRDLSPLNADEFLRNRPDPKVPDGVSFENLTMSQQHAALREVFDNWMMGQYPGATMIGDAVCINLESTQGNQK